MNALYDPVGASSNKYEVKILLGIVLQGIDRCSLNFSFECEDIAWTTKLFASLFLLCNLRLLIIVNNAPMVGEGWAKIAIWLPPTM